MPSSEEFMIPGVPAAELPAMRINIEATGGTIVKVEQAGSGKVNIHVRYPRVALAVPQGQPAADAGTATGTAAPGVETMAWGATVGADFRAKLRDVAATLVCDPSHLMAVIHFETAGTFSPAIQHPATNATGLIQFVPSTAEQLGTTIDNLKAMSQLQQLDMVVAYFQMFNFFGKLHTLSDVYMAVLYPAAVGRPEAHVLFAQGSEAYRLNRGLDLNGDGAVTKHEASSHVQRSLEVGLRAGNRG